MCGQNFSLFYSWFNWTLEKTFDKRATNFGKKSEKRLTFLHIIALSRTKKDNIYQFFYKAPRELSHIRTLASSQVNNNFLEYKKFYGD